jgi:hypothetical protein
MPPSTHTYRFLIILRILGCLLALANVIISIYTIALHYNDENDSDINNNDPPRCVLLHKGSQSSCELHGHIPKTKNKLSLPTVFITSLWISFFGLILAWGYARAPQNAQGIIGFARSRFGRSGVFILIGSFAAALGYDDRSEQDGMFIVGVIDLVFGIFGILSYICIRTAETGDVVEAVVRAENDNPFLPLEEEDNHQ